MAYCSYCAAVLDPAQPVCSRCGRAAETVARPASVKIAATLLLGALLLSFLFFAGIFIAPGLLNRLPMIFWMRTIAFWIVWIVLLSLFWQRQGWTRIAMVALIVWNIFNIALSFARTSGLTAASFGISTSVLIDAIRLTAVYLMFKPASNAWFKK